MCASARSIHARSRGRGAPAEWAERGWAERAEREWAGPAAINYFYNRSSPIDLGEFLFRDHQPLIAGLRIFVDLEARDLHRIALDRLNFSIDPLKNQPVEVPAPEIRLGATAA